MRIGIAKLKRRIEELKGVNVGNVRDLGDANMSALRGKIDTTLVDIFGADSIDYQRHKVEQLYTGGIYFGMTNQDIHEGYRDGIARAIANLDSIIDMFVERLDESGETPAGQAARAFEGLDLHPEILRAAGQLFEDGHYAQAVDAACKVLVALIRMRSGREDLSGTELMQHVFSPKSPVLRFSGLTTESERDEQQGMMFLYSGAMLALRNPRAHELIEDKPAPAVAYLGFLSMLAKELDRTKR